MFSLGTIGSTIARLLCLWISTSPKCHIQSAWTYKWNLITTTGTSIGHIVDHCPSPILPHSHSPTLLFKPLSFPPHFPLPLHPPPPLNRPILLFLLPSWSLQLTLWKRKQKQIDFLCKRKNITQWQMTAKLCAINP